MNTKAYTRSFRFEFKNLFRSAKDFSKGVLALTGVSASLSFVGLIIGAVVSIVPAWFTHVFVCLKHEEWGFLIGGALFFPVAIVHGWGIWFGWW
jgi:hypothetical protein